MDAPAEVRIVLLGKTGSGKSRAGNVILGEDKFEFVCNPNSITQDCQTEERNLNGRKIIVTDTAGIFDTEKSEEDLKHSIISCLTECAPGPHAFILVLRVGRYTKEEKDSVKMILKYFQKEALKHTAVLFTHGDELEENQTIEEFVKMNKDLKELFDKCDGRVHVIDSKYWKDENIGQEYRSNSFQIKQLLTTIDNMVTKNGGCHYTNESLQNIAKAIQDKVIKIIQERMKEFFCEAINRVRKNRDSMTESQKLDNIEAIKGEIYKIIKERNTAIQKEARNRIKNKILKRAVGAAVGSLLGLLLGVAVGAAVPFVALAGLLTAAGKSIVGSRSNDPEVNIRNIIAVGLVEVIAGAAGTGAGVTTAGGAAAAVGATGAAAVGATGAAAAAVGATGAAAVGATGAAAAAVGATGAAAAAVGATGAAAAAVGATGAAAAAAVGATGAAAVAVGATGAAAAAVGATGAAVAAVGATGVAVAAVAAAEAAAVGAAEAAAVGAVMGTSVAEAAATGAAVGAGAATGVGLGVTAGVFAIAGAVRGGIAGAKAGEKCDYIDCVAKEAAKAAGQAGLSTLKDVWNATQKLARSKESPYEQLQE